MQYTRPTSMMCIYNSMVYLVVHRHVDVNAESQQGIPGNYENMKGAMSQLDLILYGSVLLI